MTPRGSGRLLLTVVLLLAAPAAAQPALTLEQAVARALERNLSIEAARHRVDAARAEQIAARLHPNPTFTLSAENLKVSGPTPAGELYEVSGTLSQPLELGEKRERRRAVENRQHERPSAAVAPFVVPVTVT